MDCMERRIHSSEITRISDEMRSRIAVSRNKDIAIMNEVLSIKQMPHVSTIDAATKETHYRALIAACESLRLAPILARLNSNPRPR